MEILMGLRTDRGRHRRRNEDRVLARVTRDRAGRQLCLLAVADGMGGSPGGALASEIAVSTLEAGVDSVTEPEAILRRMFQQANAEIRKAAIIEPEYRNMGSTLVAALILENGLWVANVGDSRAYLIRGGGIRQLTKDHSWVAEQVEAGQMSTAQAARSPRRNIVTRSLGTTDAVEIDIFNCGEMEPQDLLLLCSDGLYNMVCADDIARIATTFSPQEAADRLIELANEHGGRDNIAVVIARRVATVPQEMNGHPGSGGALH